MDIQRPSQAPQTPSESRADGRSDLDARAPTRASRTGASPTGSIANDREIFLRGQRAFEQGDDQAALDSFERLTAHGIQYADVYYRLGILHERRDELDEAIQSLRSAIRINPSYVEALLALASLFERRGDFDQSQSHAERASQLARAGADGLDATTRGKLANQQATLGDALAQAGEMRDAIEEYRRALERCPTFHDIRHRLGMTLREAGLPFQAAQEFRRILRVHPGMLDSQIQLGLTYYSMGRTPEAIKEWEAVLEIDVGRDEALMYLRLVRGAKMRTARPAQDRFANNQDLALDGGSSDRENPSDTKNTDRPDDAIECLNHDLEISGWSTPGSDRRTGEPNP